MLDISSFEDFTVSLVLPDVEKVVKHILCSLLEHLAWKSEKGENILVNVLEVPDCS